jgi:hypothetical protein
VRIVGRRAALRQRAEENEAGDTVGVISGKFDACPARSRRRWD